MIFPGIAQLWDCEGLARVGGDISVRCVAGNTTRMMELCLHNFCLQYNDSARETDQ